MRAIALLLLLSGCAGQAIGLGQQSARIPLGMTTSTPSGFTAMCARGDEACRPAPVAGDKGLVGGVAAPTLSSRLFDRVNRRVNAKVRRASDLRTFGLAEHWARSGTGLGAAGDCEDMALEKRAQLIGAGVPAEMLALAVVWHARVGRHTVLVVHAQEGDMVLDSRSPYIHSWRDVPYRWLSVQSPGDPMHWRAVGAEAVVQIAQTRADPARAGFAATGL
jgi:predicted transglutaminase-like cysteine proteinase